MRFNFDFIQVLVSFFIHENTTFRKLDMFTSGMPETRNMLREVETCHWTCSWTEVSGTPEHSNTSNFRNAWGEILTVWRMF